MKATFLGLLFMLSAPVRADQNETKQEIITSLFNAQLGKADSLIESAIRNSPDDPWLYFLKGHYAFYMRYFTTLPLSRDSMLTIISSNSRKAIELAETTPASLEYKFLLGSSYGLLSRVQVMKQEFWDAYWTARKGRGYLREVVKEDSTFFDAYVELGVMEYYPSRLTGFQSALSWVGGMSGDREKGLEYFGKASRNGRLLKSEATFALAYIYRFLENDFQRAGSLFSSLQETFPQNVYFRTQRMQSDLGHHIETSGVQFLQSVRDSLETTYQIRNSGVLNTMAYAFLGKGKTEVALSVFKFNIELYPEEANPYDSIAECYQGMGETALAIRYTRMALERLPGDSTISDEFRANLKEILETRLDDLGASPGA